MAYQIQIRNDVAATWTSVNPILAQGEFGYESDTQKIKVGDGATHWVSLPYIPYFGAITQLTGDGTAIGPGSVAFTLTSVNGNVGTFGDASHTITFTVNAKGLITAASINSILIAESQVTNLVSDLAGKQPVGNYITALTGDATAAGPGSVAVTFATVNSNVGTFGSSTAIPALTVNAKGLTTAATTNPVIAPAGTLTGTTLAAGVVNSSLTQVGTITTGVWNGTAISGFSFLTSGTTYTTPAGITTRTVFEFTLIGGGGGGGGMNTANGKGCGGGGGGAGKLFITGLSPSTAYTIAIGVAGVGGTYSPLIAGTAGTATTLTIGATTYTANGGGGGADTVSTLVGGAGGTAVNCTINVAGQNGMGSASASAASMLPSGGDSGFGFGLGGAGSVSFVGNDGFGGTGYGGGGAGAGPGTGIAGSGSAGCILVEWSN